MEQYRRNLDVWIPVWIAKIRLGLCTASEYSSTCLQRTTKQIIELSRRIAEERRKLRRARLEREYHLAKLLSDSAEAEAIVVTDDSHRLLVANQAALSLLGISRKNINRFTIDAFLPYSQVTCFERNGPPFSRIKRCGVCEIRRLDGSLKTVDFSFHANFVRGRHLSIFRVVPVRNPMPDQRRLFTEIV
jgi:PAS domain-containing protein